MAPTTTEADDELTSASQRMRADDRNTLVSRAIRCGRRARSNKMLSFAFALALLLSLYFLETMDAMMQRTSITNGVLNDTQHTLANGWRDHPDMAKLYSYFSSVDVTRMPKTQTLDDISSLSEYECVGWRQTNNCTPQGQRDPGNDRNCSDNVKAGSSGYCELRHTLTGEAKHVMPMHCNSLKRNVVFRCDMFQSLLSYGALATDYVHDANFSFEANVQDLQRTNKLLEGNSTMVAAESKTSSNLTFERGIVYVIYNKVLLSAYVSVRSLRAFGCTLPIEMWFKGSETSVNHELLKLLVAEYGVYLREITDRRATRFYTKLHAVFYSAFDSVLLLDADNFAVKDPTYLFDSTEFVANGAIFWPDYWQPSNTQFNIHKDSFVWQVFDLEFVDMFEQESGQVLINRRKHQQALNVLMYYGFSLPRIHDDLRLVWGDKDLFRFSWMKVKADFYMIPGPPGSAGTKISDSDVFCGVTIVQHDLAGDVIFLHRNAQKLTASNDRFIWTHIQQFKPTANVSEHIVRGVNDGHIFPQFKLCYGRETDYLRVFTVKPMSAFPFREIEATLVNYTREGAAISIGKAERRSRMDEKPKF